MVVAKKNLDKIFLIFMLIALFALIINFNMTSNKLSGTARVVNYAGIVRGATQRLIKLEIVDQPNDELIHNLDTILYGLRNGSSEHNLVKVEDDDLQKKLAQQNYLWEQLKNEINFAREVGFERTNLVELSEKYFDLANQTVYSAENFSEKQGDALKHSVFIALFIILALVINIGFKIANSVKLMNINKELSEQATIDLLTQLPNKSKCYELIKNKSLLLEPTAVIVFDLNHIKRVNDTLGHVAGDLWIEKFATIARKSIPEEHFVGRYGGDEFIAVLYNTSEDEIEEYIEEINKSIKLFNNEGRQMDLSYSYGFDISIYYTTSTISSLFKTADHNMMNNKKLYHKNSQLN